MKTNTNQQNHQYQHQAKAQLHSELEFFVLLSHK